MIYANSNTIHNIALIYIRLNREKHILCDNQTYCKTFKTELEWRNYYDCNIVCNHNIFFSKGRVYC
jgi:hypothetical protein